MFGVASVWVVIGLSIIGLMCLFGMIARLYRKAGPNEALVVYGFRGTRIVIGRGTLILPMLQSYRQLSLELMSFDVAPPQDLYTKQGSAVNVETRAQLKVKAGPAAHQTHSH